jgi:hypothetical protein
MSQRSATIVVRTGDAEALMALRFCDVIYSPVPTNGLNANEPKINGGN